MKPEFVVPLAIANLFALAILLTSIFRPKVCRWLLVALFGWAAVTNTLISIINPQAYLEYAPIAVISSYRNFILGVFANHVALFVIPIAIAQAGIAYTLTRKGLPFTLAIVGITIFLLAISPLGAGAGGSFTVMVPVAAWILWRQRGELESERPAFPI